MEHAVVLLFPRFVVTPTLDDYEITHRLARLFPVDLSLGSSFDRELQRLADRFKSYAETIPHGLWGPGLILSHEMVALSELLLPLAELCLPLRRLFAQSLTIPFPLAGTLLEESPSWLHLLQSLPPHLAEPNPARLVERLIREPRFRQAYLFAISLPPRVCVHP
jgi:hypothetical protein